MVERKLIAILLLLVAFSGKCQERVGFGLFTDQDVYASGETILVKIFAPSDEQPGTVMVDLFNCKGKQVADALLEMRTRQADGFINLSDTLSSGSYLVRTTTRTSLTQTVKEIFIVNRFTGFPLSNSLLRQSGVNPLLVRPNQQLQIEGVENSYRRRDKGRATLHMLPELLSQTDGNLLVSISRQIPEYISSTFILDSKPRFFKTVGNEGMIISGNVTDQETVKPFQNALVFLSVPDSSPRFQYYTTGENGHFFFQLKKYYGEIPVLLQCFDTENKRQLKISVDIAEDFQTSLHRFESVPISAEFREIVAKSVEALNFSKIFNQHNITIEPVPEPSAVKCPFYGVPTRVVYPRQFIDLPNFDEISRELLQGIRFRENNHILSLQLFNFQRNKFFDDPPLVLLNGIPVRDLQLIKNLGTKEIDRIDVCLTERFYGNLQFSGVLAIYTSKSDCSWLNESDSFVKLRLNAIQPPSILNIPSDINFKEPDLRRVLLWLPSLEPAQNIKIDFQVPDIRGKYRLIIRGIGRDGKVFFNEQSFEVN